MKTHLFILAFFVLNNAYAQDSTYQNISIPNIELSDTVFMGYTLEPVDVFSIPYPKNLGLSSRDKAYLRKVYPYALRVSHLVEQLDKQINAIDKNRKRKKYISEMEKMLKEQFTDDVKDLTRIQGQMLTKLIYRETNRTVFELIKNYKNGFSAGWWNLLGKFYSQDLRLRYEPKGKDQEIEKYVRYLDQVYQRDGIKEEIQHEQFTPPVQDKKRKRRGN
ncbi:MAG: DUF4294 domain-containing protein [Chitinophagales bacterium]|nr:DUF4294 domain-containing protein [Chitinophagales bacterium]MCZ2392759.1 DUF4294 domain-containing protein [Chitinophagales bacterium]